MTRVPRAETPRSRRPTAADVSAASSLDARARQSFRRRLLAWYAKHARDLPWRRSRDPYRVWLSEVMLQQTTVAAVKPFFERFLTALPTVEALAAAKEQQVLRLWEGLGYYRRARGLHAAAKMIVGALGGKFPRDVPALMTLPGVGRYTAGAVASIAFDVRAPILEANTIRLLSRIVGYRDDPAKAAGQRLLWQTAEDLLPQRDVARFNQALMELGSLLCTPTAPKCSSCPVAEHCAAFALGLQEQIPAVVRPKAPTDVREAAVVVRKNGAVLMRQYAAGERWGGLWDFPRFAVEAENPHQLSDEIVEKVQSQTGITVTLGTRLTTLRHGVTRFRITLDCYESWFATGRLRSTTSSPAQWAPTSALREYPLSTSARRIASLLQ